MKSDKFLAELEQRIATDPEEKMLCNIYLSETQRVTQFNPAYLTLREDFWSRMSLLGKKIDGPTDEQKIGAARDLIVFCGIIITMINKVNVKLMEHGVSTYVLDDRIEIYTSLEDAGNNPFSPDELPLPMSCVIRIYHPKSNETTIKIPVISNFINALSNRPLVALFEGKLLTAEEFGQAIIKSIFK